MWYKQGAENTRVCPIGYTFAIRAPRGAFVDCARTLVFSANTEGLRALLFVCEV
jgi:hypothetical protein